MKKFILNKRNLNKRDKLFLAHINFLRISENEDRIPEKTRILKENRDLVIKSFVREREDEGYETDRGVIKFRFGKIINSTIYTTRLHNNRIQNSYKILIEDKRTLRKTEQEERYRHPTKQYIVNKNYRQEYYL